MSYAETYGYIHAELGFTVFPLPVSTYFAVLVMYSYYEANLF